MFFTLLSAVLFYFSFPNSIYMYGFWPCIWVFGVPLLVALRGQSWKKRVLYGIIFGLVSNGLMANGLYAISPAGFLAFAFCLSLQGIVFALLFKNSGRAWFDIIYLAVIWCASEWLRNAVMGGFSFYISHAQAFCPPMLKLYGIVGCLGMSFIIFLVNGLVYSAIIYKELRRESLIIAAAIFLSIVGLGLMRTKVSSERLQRLRIAVIQANISPWQKADLDLFDRNATIHLQLTKEANEKAHPDLIIWPETAFPDDLLQSEEWRPLIMDQAAAMKSDILIGIAPIINGNEYNSALLINNKGKVAGLYNKQTLVPFAETTPLEAWGIKWGRGYHFKEGKELGVLRLSSKPVLFGIVICSESAHPSLVRKMCLKKAKFLVEISNDGWFGDKASYMLHAQAAIMRAVENRIWVIRSANTGFSFAVDPDGIIHPDANLKLGHEGFGIFDIMVKVP